LINLFRLKSDKKYDKVRSDVVTISTKLKEQRFIWHTRLCDIDSSSKSLVSKEQSHRRYAVQQQLDRTSAMESQLQEFIEGLGIMNYEFVDVVKNANSTKRTAIKLYEKSKESASRHFEQLQIEKEEKNQLKDELTCVLKAQESQQKVIQEYDNMVQALKFTKLNLKRECRVGHRGGAHWPL
jgi:hypothetical protein